MKRMASTSATGLVLWIALPVLASAQGYGPGMMGGYGWGGGWGFGVVGMLLWWVLIILGIVLLAKWLYRGSRGGGQGTANRAMEILRERYARGEIDKQEFEERKRDLGG
ncbi:MAG: SHOCT domain-containing protein [Candidatus Levyibacteriota bacterium]